MSPLSLEHLRISNRHWQVLTLQLADRRQAGDRIYLYSAFHDDRPGTPPGGVVRIVSAIPVRAGQLAGEVTRRDS